MIPVTHYVELTSISIADNRQRRQFDESALQELVTSIEQNQLMHAPVLRAANGSLILVAGERRLRAIKDIYDLGGSIRYNGQDVPPGKVPYVLLGELSPLEAMEAEFEENIRRSDLTWQERASATASLMELRKAQAAARDEPSPTVADLTREVRDIPETVPDGQLGGYHVQTRKELILARHLDDPDVAKAKSVDEAYKLLQRKEVAQANARLGEEIGRTFTSKVHQLFNRDSGEWVANCAPDSFDVILMDPPYGMGADEFGDSGGMAAGEHQYEDSPEYLKELMKWLPFQTFRIAKPEAHLYCFCDIDQFVAMKLAFTIAGWKVFRTPLIWHKPTGSRAPWPEQGPQRKYETILYAMKGGKKVTRLYSDVLTYPSDKNLGHMAQKPIDLFIDLLSRSVRPGDSVIDLFCGTGPIFPAAHQLKCRATGIEKDPGAYAIAATRIKELA